MAVNHNLCSWQAPPHLPLHTPSRSVVAYLYREWFPQVCPTKEPYRKGAHRKLGDSATNLSCGMAAQASYKPSVLIHCLNGKKDKRQNMMARNYLIGGGGGVLFRHLH